MDQTFDAGLSKSVNNHLLVMLILIVGLFGGAVAWANYFQISGAVIASGTVVVETNIKDIQHQDGGIVKNIAVANGDVVKAGDILLTLNETNIGASLAIAQNRFVDLLAQEARLKAERSRDEGVLFAAYDSRADIQTVYVRAQESQTKLFGARKNRVQNEKQQLAEQILQFENGIKGYQIQLSAKQEQFGLVNHELSDVKRLFEQNLVSASRVSTLQRETFQVRADIGGLEAQIAQVKQSIAERRVQLLQVEEGFSAQVLETLSTVQGEMAGLREELIALKDRLHRMSIRAPRSGIIHNLGVHTIGAVVAPGERLMSIVPSDDLLIIEARVDPTSINQLYTNQTASIRFPSMDQRTTPELVGELTSISADLLQDQITGQQFYQIRLGISPSELKKLGDKSIVPGMPVEAFVKTQDRTVLSYLVKPIADQIAHSMRER